MKRHVEAKDSERVAGGQGCHWPRETLLHRLLVRTIWVEERKSKNTTSGIEGSCLPRQLCSSSACRHVVPMHADSAAPGRVGGSAHPANRGVPVLQGCHYWADAESTLVLDATSSTPSSSRFHGPDHIYRERPCLRGSSSPHAFQLQHN